MKKINKQKPNKIKKPRNTYLTVDMGKPVVINKLSISRDGKIEFLSNGKRVVPISSNLTQAYDRQKKPKIIFNIPTDNYKLSIDDMQTLKRYDYMYAIDTNSKMIKGDLITVSSYARFNTANLACDYYSPVVIKNDSSITEMTGWVGLIRSILTDKGYKSDLKIAIVVDSDYRNLSAYNKRQKPLKDNLFLPPNFELIYATSDTGMENLPNKMISECDKLAKIAYKKFE